MLPERVGTPMSGSRVNSDVRHAAIDAADPSRSAARTMKPSASKYGRAMTTATASRPTTRSAFSLRREGGIRGWYTDFFRTQMTRIISATEVPGATRDTEYRERDFGRAKARRKRVE